MIGVFVSVTFRRHRSQNVSRPPTGGSQFAASAGLAHAEVIVARRLATVHAIKHLPVGPIPHPAFAGRNAVEFAISANGGAAVGFGLLNERAFPSIKLPANQPSDGRILPPQQHAGSGALSVLDSGARHRFGDTLDQVAMPLRDENPSGGVMHAGRSFGRVEPVSQQMLGDGFDDRRKNRVGKTPPRFGDDAMPAPWGAGVFVSDLQSWRRRVGHGRIVAANFSYGNRVFNAGSLGKPNGRCTRYATRPRDLGCSANVAGLA